MMPNMPLERTPYGAADHDVEKTMNRIIHLLALS